MPAVSIIGTSKRVVETPGLEIDELAGNVATHDDRISIAKVKAKQGVREPFLTVDYDEWICILKGKIEFENSTDNVMLTGNAGDTVLVRSGTRFRPWFVEDSEYVPVCIPAFRPDRCIREDGQNIEGQQVAHNLKELHSNPGTSSTFSALEEESPEILYHMTSKAEWENAKSKKQAYYPQTFEVDGYYTHATGVPSRLIQTANKFYQDVQGDWICLEFRRSVLREKFGVIVKDEKGKPVGDKQPGSQHGKEDKKSCWLWPHVYGGIPLDCVEREYNMVRDGGKFVGIEELL